MAELEKTAPVRRPSKLWAQQAALLAFGLGIGTSLFAIMGACFGDLHQAFEITTHFYLQYTVALVLAVASLLVLRKFKAALFLAAFLALCLAKVAPLYMPSAQATGQAGSTLRVGTINVHTENKQYQGVIDAIRQAQPDVVGLVEIDEGWLKSLEQALAKDYPYRMAAPLPDNFGVGLFSKLPLVRQTVHSFGKQTPPCAVATIESGGKPVTFVVAHTLPPIDNSMLAVRTEEMDGFVRERELFGERFVLVGDMNSSSWSPYFVNMVRGLNARDSRQGFGLECTWPAQAPVLFTTLDHILTSKNIITRRHWVGKPTGSDHLPVFAELFVQ